MTSNLIHEHGWCRKQELSRNSSTRASIRKFQKAKSFLVCFVWALQIFCGFEGRSTNTAGKQGGNWPSRGTVIEFSVEFSAGGGYDTYTRGLAPFIEKHLPGTRVVVVNRPGADGAVALNYLYRSRGEPAKIQIVNVPGLVVRQLFGQAHYDLNQFTWLGQVSSGDYVAAARRQSPLRSAQDLLSLKRTALVATGGMADSSAITAVLAYPAMGLKFKLIPHTGMQEAIIAALRGDVDLVHAPYSGVMQMVRQGEVKVLLTFSDKRLPGLTDVPTAAELGLGESSKYIRLGRPIAAPPDIPLPQANILREAIWKAMNDPGFAAWCKKTEREWAPLNSEETAKEIAELLEVFKQRREFLEKYLAAAR
ncbi:MAG: tripartite tricarboxylate transporter substrate binding protein [Acidobacteria bacterium]|nr:tripartite tricarboxylate transporter substrate binding protein [Acidobacteriota bacterium]